MTGKVPGMLAVVPLLLMSGAVQMPPVLAAPSASVSTGQAMRCTNDGTTLSGGKVVAASFYRSMTGYAAQAGTTGGMGRTLFLVTRTDDVKLNAPRGSLRDALTRANAAGGGWIAFGPALQGKTIRLAAPLRLASNITVDGSCARPLVTGALKGSLFYLAGSRNVVMTRMSLQHADAGTQGDCITVSHGADRVWLAYMQLRQCHDGLIDVTRDGNSGPMRVTISNNRFLDHDKVMLIVGNPVTGPSCGLSRQPVQVTVFRNLFRGTGQRHPRASGDVRVDLKQNLIAFAPRHRANGTTGAAYGTLATDGAQVFIDDTEYAPPAGNRRYRIASDSVDGNGTGACPKGKLHWAHEGQAISGNAARSGSSPSFARATGYSLKPYLEENVGPAAAPLR